MALEIVRNANGTIAKGYTGNPLGRPGNPRTRIMKRIDTRLEQLMKDGHSVEDFAEQVIQALADPTKDPDLRRYALDRIWPAVAKHELTGADGGPVEIESKEQWARLAEGFGREVPVDTGLAEPEPDPTPIIGTD